MTRKAKKDKRPVGRPPLGPDKLVRFAVFLRPQMAAAADWCAIRDGCSATGAWLAKQVEPAIERRFAELEAEGLLEMRKATGEVE